MNCNRADSPADTYALSHHQLSVPAFLKLLTTGGVGLSTSEAMGAASALIKAGYNKANVSNPFVGVSEPALVAAGVTDPETRKQIIAWGRSGRSRTTSGSTSGSPSNGAPGKKRKAKGSDLDKPLPVKAEEKEAISLEFDEVMEDYVSAFLRTRRQTLTDSYFLVTAR